MSQPSATATRLDARDHGLDRDHVDRNAIDVTHRLAEAGFQAFLVGGCVRDLLLGKTPKDFDVATNAHPEDVRRVFRRSRLVGRRFRIAHVRYGRDIIEVSTFRRIQAEEEDERHHSAEGLILRDNVYGSLEEDAFRRDFTINALYYDPETEQILDFVGGLEDLEAGRLRFIGDTQVRLTEDPVRILRAIRFEAKLGFHLDPAIEKALSTTAERLAAIPRPRLFDEVSKMLLCGRAADAWARLAPTDLRRVLFPSTPPDSALVQLAMANTDARIAEDKPVTAAFLLAVLLWPDFIARIAEHAEHKSPSEARALAASETLADQQETISVPRRLTHFIRDVWSLQARLENRLPRYIERVHQHPRFRGAYDLLLLRVKAGEPLEEIADWWTTYQTADAGERARMVDERRSTQPARKRRRRRRSRRSGSRGGAQT